MITNPDSKRGLFLCRLHGKLFPVAHLSTIATEADVQVPELLLL